MITSAITIKTANSIFEGKKSVIMTDTQRLRQSSSSGFRAADYVRLLRAKITQLQMVHDRGFDLNEYPEEVKFLQNATSNAAKQTIIGNFLSIYNINPEHKDIARSNLNRIYHRARITQGRITNNEYKTLYAYYVPVSRDDTQAKKAAIDPLLTTIKNDAPTSVIVISPINLGSDAQKQLIQLKDIKLNIFLENVLQYNVTHHVLVPRHEMLENDDSLLARISKDGGISEEQKRELAARIANRKGISSNNDSKFMTNIQAQIADKIRMGEEAFVALLKSPLKAEEKTFIHDYLRIGSIYELDDAEAMNRARKRLLDLINNRRMFALTDQSSISNTRVTSKYITRFERAHILGVRAEAISKGADIMIDLELGDSDPITIAIKEFRQGKIPLIIRRDLPDGTFEDWPLRDLLPLEELGYDLASANTSLYSKDELTMNAYLRELARLGLSRTLTTEEKDYFRNPALTKEVIQDLLSKRGIADASLRIPEHPDEMWYYSVLSSRKRFSPLTDVEKSYFNTVQANPEKFFTLLDKRKYSREAYLNAVGDIKLNAQEEALFFPIRESDNRDAFTSALNKRLYSVEKFRQETGYSGPLSREEEAFFSSPNISDQKEAFTRLINWRKYNPQTFLARSGIDEKSFNSEEKAFFANPQRDGAGFIELLNKRAIRRSLTADEEAFLHAIKLRGFQPLPDSAHTRFLSITGFAPSQLEVLSHTDPVAQYYGLTSGNIVRIYRTRLFLETLVNTIIAYRIVI